jgi:hypothetical protein
MITTILTLALFISIIALAIVTRVAIKLKKDNDNILSTTIHTGTIEHTKKDILELRSEISIEEFVLRNLPLNGPSVTDYVNAQKERCLMRFAKEVVKYGIWEQHKDFNGNHRLVFRLDVVDGNKHSQCKCEIPRHNYPEMLWCDNCGKEI